ncbi:MAG: ATP-binding protein [Pseudomonadota bacterium]
MKETTSSIIRKAAQRVRTRDYLWANAIAAGILLVIGVSGFVKAWWLPVLAWCCFAAALLVRFRVSASRAWAEPVEQVFDTEIGAQKAEIEALKLAHGIVEAMPEPLFILDVHGFIENANPAAREFVTSNELEHRHFTSVLRAPIVYDAVNEVVDGKATRVVDFTITGSVDRYCKAFVTPLGEASRPDRVLVYLRDLTRERRIEKMRVDFIASASHELRTPLASVLGFIETLKGHAKSDPEAQEKFLGIMQAQAERMQRLVSDLMSLSKIELHEHVRPRDTVDLCEATNELIESVKPITEQSNTSIEFFCDCGPVVNIVADRDQILQAVQNLIDNATKYAASGDRTDTSRVEVRVGVGEAPGHPSKDACRIGDTLPQLVGRQDGNLDAFGYVQVRDYGAGIPRHNLPRLTERFYRVNVEQSRRTGGTGLGLAIVKHIMNRHGGGLSIESAEGEGTSFTCYFPMAESQAQAAE